MYRTSQNIRITCFSWVTVVRVLCLAGSHSLSHLTRMPSNTLLISGPAVGTAQSLIWSYSCVFLPPMSTAIRNSAFSLVGALSDFYIFDRHRIFLADRMDLICSLYSWWECFGSSSLTTLPLGFNCGFISTSVCWSSTGVCPWCCAGGLVFAPVRPGMEIIPMIGSQGIWLNQVLRGVGS